MNKSILFSSILLFHGIVLLHAQETTIVSKDIPQNYFIRSAEVTPNGRYVSLNFGGSGSGAWDIIKNEYIEHGETYVSGITDNGIMVGQKDGMPVYGTEGNWTQLYVNEGMYGMAEAVTPDGKFICGWIDSDIEPGSTQAVIWNIEKNDQYYALGDLDLSEYGHGVTQSRAISISDDGKTIVGNYISVSNFDNVAAVWTWDEETGEYIEIDIHKGYLTNMHEQGKYVASDIAKVSPDGKWIGGTFYGQVLDEQTDIQHLPFAYNIEEQKMYFYIWDTEVRDNQLMDIANDGTVYCIGNNYGGISDAVALYGTPQNEKLITLEEHFNQTGINFKFEPNSTVPVAVNSDNTQIILCTADEEYNKAVHSISLGTSGLESLKQDDNTIIFDQTACLLKIDASVCHDCLEIIDSGGSVLLREKLQKGENTITLQDLPDGIYLVKTNQKCIKILKN